LTYLYESNRTIMSQQELDALSTQEKLDLIEQLWHSLNRNVIPLTEAQQVELDHRLAKRANGTGEYVPEEEVWQRLNEGR